MRKLLGGVVVLALVAAGAWVAAFCPCKEAASVAEAAGPAMAQEGYQGGAVEGGGSIGGTVTVTGDVPAPTILKPDKDTESCGGEIESDVLIVSSENNGLKNALVSITNISKGKEPKFHSKEDPAVLDQGGCMFHPHVLVVNAGSWVVYKNSKDPVSHNTNVASKFGQGYNKLLPSGGASEPVQLKEAEKLKVKCDIHPWMAAWIAVMGNPYWSLTDEKGGFKIDNVPPGTYTLSFWHEKMKKKEMEITVEAQKEAKADAALQIKKSRRRR